MFTVKCLFGLFNYMFSSRIVCCRTCLQSMSAKLVLDVWKNRWIMTLLCMVHNAVNLFEEKKAKIGLDCLWPQTESVKSCIFCTGHMDLTCVLPAVHLQVGQFEVSLTTAWVRAHERTFLTALWWFNGGSDAWYSPHILKKKKTENNWQSANSICQFSCTFEPLFVLTSAFPNPV